MSSSPIFPGHSRSGLREGHEAVRADRALVRGKPSGGLCDGNVSDTAAAMIWHFRAGDT
jgi:hypothetical protein